MSGTDDEGHGEAAASFPKRERVTLKWSAQPLLLPGEEELPTAPPNLESTALALPDVDGESRPEAVDPAPGEAPGGSDGWDRLRPSGPATVEPSSGTRSSAPPAEALEGGALSLVDRRSRDTNPSTDLAAEMRDRYALGDYTAALRAAELILGGRPEHADAREVSRSCRARLAQLYGSRLGSLKQTPTRVVDDAEIRWLGLDHRAGFLLSRVDGTHTLEEVLDISGMPRLEALKTLVELLEMGAIRLRG